MIDIVIIISLLTIFSGIAVVIDKYLNDEDVEDIKEKILNWWIYLQEDFDLRASLKKSNEYFTDLMNSIYGNKHLSFTCFIRSAFSSFFAFFLILIMSLVFGYSLDDVFSGVGFSGTVNIENAIVNLGFALVFSLIINVPADYISLVGTRVLLRIAKNRSVGILLAILFLDFILNGIVILLVPTILCYASNNSNLIYCVSDLFFTSFDPFTIMFFSTFFTSFLFYLFIITTFILSFTSTYRNNIVKLLERISSWKNPITNLAGIISGILLMLKGLEALLKFTSESM